MGRVVVRLPLSICLLTATLAAGMATIESHSGVHGRVMDAAGWNLDALKRGQLYRLWAGLPFAGRPGPSPTMIGLLVLGPGLLEWQRGTRIAAAGFLLAGPALSLLTTLVLWTGSGAGVSAVSGPLTTLDVGSSSASLACWGIACGFYENAARRRAALVVTTAVLIGAQALDPRPYGIDHLVAFAVAHVGTRMTLLRSLRRRTA